MTRSLFAAFAVVFTLLALAPAAQAQADDDVRRVVLLNGDVYVGVVEDEMADPVVIVTQDGVRREFRRAQVDFIAPLINGRFFRTDPVKTRFFVAPTARTLGGGEFRGDLTYIFPSITAGVSDRVDFLASGLLGFASSGGDDEVFFTPLVGLKGQVYSAERTKVALGLSAQVQLGGGSTAASGIPYIVGTFGDETQAFTVGVGGALGSFDGEVEIVNGVLYGFGFERQVNNGVKLYVEALGTFGAGGTDDELSEGLLILPGVRFFGSRFAFDVIGFLATDFDTVVGFAPVGARASYSF